MIRASALHIALAAALLLTACAGRSTAPGMVPVAVPAPVESSAAAVPELLPVIARLAIVQTAAPAQLEFRDAELGDLRAPRSALGERTKTAATYGATPGLALLRMSMGEPGAAVLGGVVALAGLALGAVTGAIVGGVQDAVNRSGIPSAKIERYTPRLQAAGSDLVYGPLALRGCVAEQLGPTTQAQAATPDAPDLDALAQQDFSHVLTLDAIELAFVREPHGDAREDRQERFSVTLTARYRVHELADPPRVVHTGAVRHGAPALRLDRWAADQAREVHELAARGCALLAEEIGAEIAAGFSLVGN